jgi:Fe-S oxidoreductase
MSKLINQKMVESIHSTGCFTKNGDKKRIEHLKEYNLPFDEKAENVIITGCLNVFSLMDSIKSLANIFDHYGVSYTFLSKEFCCGNYLYRPAIKVRDQETLKKCQEISKEFVGKNLEYSKQLGANCIILFCPPCYPVYKYAFPEENIKFYPEALNEVMDIINYQVNIDYYAGCYRLHKYFSPVPMDLKSTDDVFSKIKGLEINRISAPQCCYKPEGLKHMVENVETKKMVHICTGCYGQAKNAMREEKDVNIILLPKFIEDIINK